MLEPLNIRCHDIVYNQKGPIILKITMVPNWLTAISVPPFQAEVSKPQPWDSQPRAPTIEKTLKLLSPNVDP